MKTCVYCASFDPPTKGHEWIIQQGAKLFDKLIIAIGENKNKTETYQIEQRKNMLTNIVDNIKLNNPTYNIEVVSINNDFTVVFSSVAGACYLLRGIRDESDFCYEQIINRINSDICLVNGIEPVVEVFLIPPRDLTEISSNVYSIDSLIKGLVGYVGWEKVVKKYVSDFVFKEVQKQHNKERFKQLWESVGCSKSEYIYSIIEKKYSEKHRKYHTLEHIYNSLIEFDKVKHSLNYPNFVELAIWFHDIVYDIKKDSETNELKSCKFLDELMKDTNQYYERYDITVKINKLILAEGLGNVLLNDEKYFIDIDYSGFGRDSYEEHLKTNKLIEEEYMSKYSLKKVINGRIKFLNELNKRESIYFTDYFKNKYESNARSNINMDCNSYVIKLNNLK